MLSCWMENVFVALICGLRHLMQMSYLKPWIIVESYESVNGLAEVIEKPFFFGSRKFQRVSQLDS